MEEILANVDDITFEIERQIENQVGLLPLPFPSMDKSGAAVCEFHLKANCERGNSCPLRHTVGDQTVVCKHWLRGLCKKGDKCEFLHVYDMSKMPECFFYSKYNACTNKECPFLHIDPSTKKKDCPWYERGFCRHGPSCRHKHTKRVLCMNYVAGFCPKGPECRHVHPKHNVNPAEQQHQNHPQQQQHQQHQSQNNASNHHQAQPHHEQHHLIPTLIQHQPTQPRQMQQNHPQPLQVIPVHQNMHHHHQQQQQMFHNQHNQHNQHSVPHIYTPFQDGGQFNVKPHSQHQPQQQMFSEQPQSIGYPQTMMNRRPINQVICYKCGALGHYANRCTVKKNMAY